MSQPLRFFRKNLIDRDNPSAVSFIVTDPVALNTGENFTSLMLNRDNTSGWATTGSTDAATTTLEARFADLLQFDTVILAGHNMKSYTLKYWDADTTSWIDFSTVVAPTDNAKDTTFHQFNTVNSSRLQLVINSTQVADADKVIAQFIVTRKIGLGQFEGWPILKKPTVDLTKKKIETISGKAKIIQRVGAYSVTMDFSTWPSNNDLSLLEEIHFYHQRGFLFWPAAGDEEQFRYKRIGFRNKDIFLCGVVSEWSPEWEKGIYVNGISMRVSLVEVV